MLARLVALALVAVVCFGGRRYERDIAVFSFDQHPDLPLRSYAEGKLGIVQPSYARSYLYVAYRLIEGAGFNLIERNQVVDYWNWKLRGERPESDSGTALYDRVRGLIDIPWQAPEEPNQADASFSLSPQFVFYQRCSDDAFRTATQTLQARIAKFGRDNLNTYEWVLGQDYVFENCLSPKPGYVPPPAPQNADPLIKSDRDYQIAAALFYSGQFSAAERAFRVIAAQPESPWTVWGPYLAGRSILWRARQLGSRAPDYVDVLLSAEAQLRSVLDNSDLAPTHDAARYLMLRIQVLIKRRVASAVLGARLMSPLGAPTRLQDLFLFTTLLDNAQRRVDRRQAIAESHELGDWVLTFQSTREEALTHSLEKWRETGSIAWLLAAISKAQPHHPDASEIIAATSRASGHVAQASLLFHAARLASGDDYRLARSLLDRLMPLLEGLPSARNRAVALRSTVAADLPDLLSRGVTLPALITKSWGQGSYLHRWELPADDQRVPIPTLEPQTVEALNFAVPLEELAAHADRPPLPAHLRTRLGGIAWVRAVLLGQWEIARRLAPRLAASRPALRADLEDFSAAPDRDMAFLAALTLVRAPGLSPFLAGARLRRQPIDQADPGGANWWWWPTDGEGAAILPKAPQLAFFSDEQVSKALSEMKVLRILRDGYEWLLSQAIVQARQSRPHDRAAEMLYEALTKLDGVDLQNGHYRPSDRVEPLRREAQGLLTERFPDSPWTAKIPPSPILSLQ